MSDLDPLLLRAFKAGRAENPDAVQGKARALAALGLSPTPEGPMPSPAPSGPRLVPGARTMSRSPWLPLVVTVFVAGGATWFTSDGATTPASNGAPTSVTTLAEASPTPSSETGMTLPIPPEPATPPSVKTAESMPGEAKAAPAVAPPRAGDAARVSTRSVADLPDVRVTTMRADPKGAAAPAAGNPVNPPCPGCDSSSSPGRSEGAGTTTGAGAGAGAGASLREEIEALERASSALSERHCVLARRALAAYRSTFPNGKLEREADVVDIEITGRSGDIDGARAAARRFVERFPNNPYSLRLRPWLQSRESDPASNIPLCVDATR